MIDVVIKKIVSLGAEFKLANFPDFPYRHFIIKVFLSIVVN